MESHGFGDLAGFIENYFGQTIKVGEKFRILPEISSVELIEYAEECVACYGLEKEEIIILENLIEEEISRGIFLDKLLGNVHFEVYFKQ